MYGRCRRCCCCCSRRFGDAAVDAGAVFLFRSKLSIIRQYGRHSFSQEVNHITPSYGSPSHLSSFSVVSRVLFCSFVASLFTLHSLLTLHYTRATTIHYQSFTRRYSLLAHHWRPSLLTPRYPLVTSIHSPLPIPHSSLFTRPIPTRRSLLVTRRASPFTPHSSSLSLVCLTHDSLLTFHSSHSSFVPPRSSISRPWLFTACLLFTPRPSLDSAHP